MNRGYQTASKKYREQNPEGTSENTSATSTSSPRGPAGGMPDLASLLNNPMLMNLAQQMTSTGAFGDIVNNPHVREMAQGVMSGQRNINDVMADPAMQNMYFLFESLLIFRARQFGLGGGGAGAGAGAQGGNHGA
jgi:small glutamine-rich tetratricopeptide repeat-containing protein alpha